MAEQRCVTEGKHPTRKEETWLVGFPRITSTIKFNFGSITLLIQDDVGGLHVLKDGDHGGDRWVTIKPLLDVILVGAFKLQSVWSFRG